MNIIVEGSDASGKSVFIGNLEKLTGKKVIRGGSFDIAQMGGDGMFEWYKTLLENNNDTIFNRFFYSNIVYGKLYNYPMMTEEQYAELNDLVSQNAVVYYLDAKTETLVKRIEKRGDDMVKSNDIPAIQKGYAEMWKTCIPKTFIPIETDNNEVLDIKSEIYQTVINNDSKMNYIEQEFNESV